jgi:trigger factor
LQKNAHLKGFRLGKAPRHVIEAFFKERVEAEVRQNIITETFRKIMTEHNFEPCVMPVTKIDNNPAKGQIFKYNISFDLKPKIEKISYENIKLEEEKIEVTEDEIAKAVSKLADDYSVLKEIEENRETREDDFVDIDYKAPTEKLFKNEIFKIEKKDKQVDLDKNIIGMKKGEEKEIEITTKNNNEKIKIIIKVNSIKYKETPQINDDFAVSLGKFKNLNELREFVTNNIKSMKIIEAKNKTNKKIIDHLVQSNTFVLPKTLLEEEISYALKPYYDKEKNLKISSEAKVKIEEEVTNNLKKLFVIEEIAKNEKIDVKEEEIESRLQMVAKSIARPIKEIVSFYEKNNLLGKLKLDMLEQKVVEFIYNKLKI